MTYTEVLAKNTEVMERLVNHLRNCPQDTSGLEKLEGKLEHTNENIAALKEKVEQYNAENRMTCGSITDCLAELKRIVARGEQWREDHAGLHDEHINPKLASVDVWKGINTLLSALFAAIAGLIASLRQ